MLGIVAAAAALSAPIIDNDRVTVWDVRVAPGEAAPAPPADRDSVVLRLDEPRFGEATYLGRGARSSPAAGPAHALIVALKDAPHAPVANTSGLPAAFPRPGSVKVLETPRVVVWNYSWAPGQATPMHFHDKDVVVAYRYDGALKSVTPAGQETVNAYKAGDVRFNRADRAHYELLVGERQSAVMVELK